MLPLNATNTNEAIWNGQILNDSLPFTLVLDKKNNLLLLYHFDQDRKVDAKIGSNSTLGNLNILYLLFCSLDPDELNLILLFFLFLFSHNRLTPLTFSFSSYPSSLIL